MTDRVFRFVPNEQVSDWSALGWADYPEALKDTHHGVYSTLMEWVGVGEPVEPLPATHTAGTHQ